MRHSVERSAINAKLMRTMPDEVDGVRTYFSRQYFILEALDNHVNEYFCEMRTRLDEKLRILIQKRH